MLSIFAKFCNVARSGTRETETTFSIFKHALVLQNILFIHSFISMPKGIHLQQMLKKKLSCCRDTALFGQISDSGRSVNTNESVNMTYVNFINMSFNISNSVPSYVVSADMLRIDKHIA